MICLCLISSCCVPVVRLKGEENTVMRDYVLPDFSTIKKGFCKVRKHHLSPDLTAHLTDMAAALGPLSVAQRGDGLQREVQNGGADPQAGQRALCCPWNALPPVWHRHPGDGNPRGHRGLHPVPTRRSDMFPHFSLCYRISACMWTFN